jgi:hypothetical protein
MKFGTVPYFQMDKPTLILAWFRIVSAMLVDGKMTPQLYGNLATLDSNSFMFKIPSMGQWIKIPITITLRSTFT